MMQNQFPQRIALQSWVWMILAASICPAGGCASTHAVLRPGASGRVVDSVSGQPVAGADVVLEGPLRWEHGTFEASTYTGNTHTVTDSDGKFDIDPLIGLGYRAYTTESNGVVVSTGRVNVQKLGYLSQHVLFTTDAKQDLGSIQLKHR